MGEIDELQCKARDGKIHYIKVKGSTLSIKKTTHLLLIIQDITEQREATTRYASLNRLYTVLSESNKVIVRHTNQQDLFNDVCKLIINQGRFRMAWIGLLDKQRVNPVASFGITNDYVAKSNIRIDDSAYAQGPIGQAIITREVCHVDNIHTDKNFAPWREAALKNGYHSVAALPLIPENKVIGVVAIYADEAYTFDKDILNLLSDMSSDLSYALTYISNEEKRQRYAQRIDQLSQVVEQSANAVSLIDINGKIRYINAGFSKLTGYRADEILGKPTNVLAVNEQQLEPYTQIFAHLETHQEWRGELEHRSKHGNTYWSKHVISQIKDTNDNMTHYVDTAEDSSDLHLAQNEIQQLAFYDSLTSLPNRRLLQDRLTKALARARRQQHMIALLYINLSQSSDAPQTLSNEEKESRLKENADIINSSIREMDSAVRLSGDHNSDTFAVLLTDLSDFTAATRVAKNIISSLSPDDSLSGNRLQITTNIGISLFPQDGDTLEQLLNNANTAMHHAKANRINHFMFYAHRMNNTHQTLPERQEHLHEASKNKDITRNTETH